MFLKNNKYNELRKLMNLSTTSPPILPRQASTTTTPPIEGPADRAGVGALKASTQQVCDQIMEKLKNIKLQPTTNLSTPEVLNHGPTPVIKTPDETNNELALKEGEGEGLGRDEDPKNETQELVTILTELIEQNGQGPDGDFEFGMEMIGSLQDWVEWST